MTTDRYVTPSGLPDPHRPVIVYLRERSVVVTSRYVRVGPDQYDVAYLTNLMRTRGSVHPGAVVGLVISAVEGVLIVPLVSVLRVPVLWPLAVLALLIPALVGFACTQRWPAQYELLADYRGRSVVVYATRDQYEFGRVARAIGRAVAAYRS